MQKVKVTLRDGFVVEGDKFDDDDFERASENYDNAKHLDDYELCWQDVQYSETTLLIQTLFSIAEVIEEYENK